MGSNPRVEHVRARYIRTRQRVKRPGWYLRDGAFVFFSRRRPSPYRVLQVVVHFRDGVPYRGEVEDIPVFMAPWWVQAAEGSNRMMDRQDIDALRDAREVLERHGFDAEHLTDCIEAAVQGNADEACADAVQRLHVGIDRLLSVLRNPVATVTELRGVACAVVDQRGEWVDQQQRSPWCATRGGVDPRYLVPVRRVRTRLDQTFNPGGPAAEADPEDESADAGDAGAQRAARG